MSAEPSKMNPATTRFVDESLRRNLTSPPQPYLNSDLVVQDACAGRDMSGVDLPPCKNQDLVAVLARVKYLLLNESVYAAYAAVSMLPQSRVKEVFEQQWPRIIIAEKRGTEDSKVQYGRHLVGTGEDRRSIYLDASLISCFENGFKEDRKNMTLLLFAFIMHELAHYLLGSTMFGFYNEDTREENPGRDLKEEGKAGEVAEKAIFGGVWMIDPKDAYKHVLVGEDDSFEPFDISEIVSKFWNEDMALPFIKQFDVKEGEQGPRAKETFARSRRYDGVMELFYRNRGN